MKTLSKTILIIATIAWVSGVEAQNKTSPSKSNTSKPKSKTVQKENYLNVQEGIDSDPGISFISYREDGKLYNISMKNGKVIEMSIDGKKIPESDFGKYDAVIAKVKEQIKRDREQAEEDRKQADKDREQAEKDMEQAKADQKEAEEQREISKHDMKEADEQRKQAQKDREQAEEDRKQAAKDRQQAELDRKQAEEDRRIYKALVADLISEKVISSESSLRELKLTDSELIINGVKKPAALHQKFKAKYLTGKHTQIMFQNNESVRNLSIDSKEEQ